MADMPNVLLITADQMRGDALGCNGNEFIDTPNLDALAARGVTFTNACSPNPICVPGRACITTGNYSHVCTGTKNNTGLIRDDQIKIAGRFADAGYQTTAIGKLHYVPYSPPGKPRLVHGFQRVELCESGRILNQFDPTGKTRGLEDFHDWLVDEGWGGYERAHATGNNDVHPAPSPLPAEYHEESWVATRSIENLREHLAASPGKPFFMWSSFAKPHSPYDPPRPWDAKYDPREIPPPIGNASLLADRDPYLRTCPVGYGWDKLSPQAIQNARAHYFGMVSFQDYNIGRLLGFLEEAGELDNTIVIYTADHGDLLGDYGCFFKVNMFAGSVGIPLIFAGPGVAAQEPSDTLAGLQDILPTVAEMTGASLPRSVMGESLTGVLDGSANGVREYFVSQSLESPRQRYMVLTDRFKYVYHELGGVQELYDVVDDRRELVNLAADRPEVVAELRGVLLDWARDNGDENILDGGNLITSPEDAEAVTEYNPGRMGWRWY